MKNMIERARDVMREFHDAGQNVVGVGDIIDQLGLTERNEKKRLYEVLNRLVRKREIGRLQKGLYRYIKPENRKGFPAMRMMRVLRARKSVTIEDLMALAEVEEDDARKWLVAVGRHGVVIERNDHYVMVTDERLDKEDDLKRQLVICGKKMNAAVKEFQKLISALNGYGGRYDGPTND